MRSVFVGGFVAGSRTIARNAGSFVICLAIFAGSETFHSISDSSEEGPLEAKNGWSLTPNRRSRSGQLEDESDESDATLGMSPRSADPSFPFPVSAIHGEHGVESAEGSWRGGWDVGAGVQVRAPCVVFQTHKVGGMFPRSCKIVSGNVFWRGVCGMAEIGAE